MSNSTKGKAHRATVKLAIHVNFGFVRARLQKAEDAAWAIIDQISTARQYIDGTVGAHIDTLNRIKGRFVSKAELGKLVCAVPTELDGVDQNCQECHEKLHLAMDIMEEFNANVQSGEVVEEFVAND